MNCVLRKPAFCICENKGTDQLGGNCTDSINQKFQAFSHQAIFCGCTDPLLSDLYVITEDRFCIDEAYLSCVMRKPAFCICENKDADQLRGTDTWIVQSLDTF